MRWLLLCLLPSPVLAEAWVTTKVIRAGTVIAVADLSRVEARIPGTLTATEAIVGQEARVTLYPGRPIRAEQVGPPALVDRNQVVPLAYLAGALAITTEGRALDRGGAGDVVRVLNLASRNTVQGRVMPDGTVRVDETKE